MPPERSRRAFRLRSTTIIPNKHVQTLHCNVSTQQTTNRKMSEQDYGIFKIFGIVKTSEQDLHDYSENPVHLLILKILCGQMPPERSRRAFRLRSTTVIPNEHVQTRLIASPTQQNDQPKNVRT